MPPHVADHVAWTGGPVGFRIAVKRPEWIDGLIIQNANAYLEGIGPGNLQGMKDRFGALSPERRTQVEQLISRNFAMFLYQTGVKHPEHLNPNARNLDSWSLDNPDGHRIQTELIINYYSNLEEYPRWQEYLGEAFLAYAHNTRDNLYLSGGMCV